MSARRIPHSDAQQSAAVDHVCFTRYRRDQDACIYTQTRYSHKLASWIEANASLDAG